MTKFEPFSALINKYRAKFETITITGVRTARAARYHSEAYVLVGSDNQLHRQVIRDTIENRKILTSVCKKNRQAEVLHEEVQQLEKQLTYISGHDAVKL